MTIAPATIAVAVLDSGVDASHPAFGKAVKVTGDQPADTGSSSHCWHGTAVAGIVAARFNAAPHSASTPQVLIRSYRITDQHGRIEDSRIVAAMQDAMANSVRVVNISASWSERNALLREAMLLAKPGAVTALGALVVVTSPGYLVHNGDQYPGVYADEDEFDFLVAVAGFSRERLLSEPGEQSIRRSPLDAKIPWDSERPDNGYAPRMLAAPGEDVSTALPGNRYGTVRGDSFAAPFVSGLAAAALLQPMYRALSAGKLRTLLFDHSCDAPAALKNLAGGAGIHCIASARFIESLNCPAVESR